MNTQTYQENNLDTGAMEYVSEQCAAISDSTKQCVENRPVTSTLVTFGTGFAIGIAIAAALGQSEIRRRSSFANQISDQVMSGLSGWIPQSFGK